MGSTIICPAIIDWTMVNIELNNARRRDIQYVGNERTPVIIIDEPVLSTEELIQYASRDGKFSSTSQFAYPGIRANLPAEYGESLAPHLVKLISEVYDTPGTHEHQLVHQLFSLVTQRPEDLGLLQRMPHTDNNGPWYFATVHYLNAGDHAGTGFFRHRPTGYERISVDRYPSYVAAAKSHIAMNGPPAQKYINESDDHFELIAEVEHKPNRMVIYPGNLLHSGLIQPDRNLNADPATGRLTANLFLYFTPPGQGIDSQA